MDELLMTVTSLGERSSRMSTLATCEQRPLREKTAAARKRRSVAQKQPQRSIQLASFFDQLVVLPPPVFLRYFLRLLHVLGLLRMHVPCPCPAPSR